MKCLCELISSDFFLSHISVVKIANSKVKRSLGSLFSRTKQHILGKCCNVLPPADKTICNSRALFIIKGVFFCTLPV